MARVGLAAHGTLAVRFAEVQRVVLGEQVLVQLLLAYDALSFEQYLGVLGRGHLDGEWTNGPATATRDRAPPRRRRRTR